MSQYMHRVNEIAAAEGISINPMEQASLLILQNEIESLEFEIEAKESSLRALDELLETTQAELKAERELNNPDKVAKDIIVDLDTITSKSNVLIGYSEVIEKGDEFRINPLVKEVGVSLEFHHHGAKQLIEKGRAVQPELAMLRAKQQELDELKKKVGDIETQDDEV